MYQRLREVGARSSFFLIFRVTKKRPRAGILKRIRGSYAPRNGRAHGGGYAGAGLEYL
jgi:hypothetical protein